MRDIFLIVGKAATGKDYIINKLCQHEDWNKMVSYTTRPMRPNEVDGVDYHFIANNDEFIELEKNGELFEKTEYFTEIGTWMYGFGNKSINNGINIAIVNPHGVEQFVRSNLRDRLYIIYMITNPDLEGDRIEKYVDRFKRTMTIEEKAEAFDRIRRDYKDFRAFENKISFSNYIQDDIKIPVLVVRNDYSETSANDIINVIKLRYDLNKENFNEK